MLIEAKNPLLSIGDEITWCNGEKEAGGACRTARRAGLRPGRTARSASGRSRSRPATRSMSGRNCANMRFSGKVDLLLNLGNRFGERAAPDSTLISIRLDPTSLARTDAGRSRHGGGYPARRRRSHRRDQQPGDPDAAARDRRRAQREGARGSAEMLELRLKIARENADRSPITMSRIGLELESALAPDTCYVCDVDSGKTMDPLMSFGGDNKKYFATGPNILGWGMAAAFGVKLARPNQPVVVGGRRRQLLLLRTAAAVEPGALPGAGHEHRAQQQELQQRAQPHLALRRPAVQDRARHDLLHRQPGRRLRQGRRAPSGSRARSSGIPARSRPRFCRAQRVIADGRPYLLDIHTQRDGIGAASTWHPTYSVADIRQRRV